ncbi:hypothetical protein MTO96_038826 [Rhipicephalus appendiculatus]
MVLTLLCNRCLTELTIARLTLVDEDMNLNNQLISRNRTLTRFNLIECKWDKAQRQNGTDAEHPTGNSVGVTSRIHSFLVALSKNKTLQELTLTPSWFNTNECRSLFETVSSHASLKTVKLEVCEREDAVEIYRAVRRKTTANALKKLPEKRLSPDSARRKIERQLTSSPLTRHTRR